jgi:hypothetical protein
VLPAAERARLSRTQITATAFEGSEQQADRGSLSEQGVVLVPARAIVTVAFASD